MLVLFGFSCLLLAADGAPPAIFWTNAPVGPNQTVLVAGHFPAPEQTEVQVALDNGKNGTTTRIMPAQVSQNSVMFTLPVDLQLWTYKIRVCSKEQTCSNELAVNKADLWWVSGDSGNETTPGGWIRLFGTNIDFAGFKEGTRHGEVALLEDRLQHAIRSRDVAAMNELTGLVSAALSGSAAGTGSIGSRAGPQLQLLSNSGTPIVLSAANSSMWEAIFKVPSNIKAGTYAVSARNQFQTEWSELDSFGGHWAPHVRSIEVLPAPVEEEEVFAVADYLERFAIPKGGLNFTTGAPVNGTAAVRAALAAAAAAPHKRRVVLLPVGKLFVDGALEVPPHTTLRGAAQELSTIYFMEDGIGRQLGGLTVAEGGSPTPDPGYIYCNCTEAWGLEHLSIYVTHFSNSVVFVGQGSTGFRMRHVLIRQVPYFCTGYTAIIPGGGNGVGKGAPPPAAARDAATTAALMGHAHRINNWTAGAQAIGAVVMLIGASNLEISDCDIVCTQWCIKADTIPWLPMGGDPPIVSAPAPPPHHLQVVRNVFRNLDVGIALADVHQSIVEHNHFLGSVLGGGALYPSSVHQIFFGHNINENHWSGDREAMTFDGNGGGAYYGPVASSVAGSTRVTLPAGASGGGDVLVVLNGTGQGQVHTVESFDPATRTYTLTAPIAVELGADSYVQALAYQAKNIFSANTFTDNGAFQIYGSGIDLVVSGNVGRRMAGMMAWGQWYPGKGEGGVASVGSVGVDMRQLWYDNEMLDENGVRNYMSNAKHNSATGARLHNISSGVSGAAEQSVEAMGSFQFNGFSFGIEGSSMANRPADAPPLNSFMVWRGNKVNSNGGFSIGADTVITPGADAASTDTTATTVVAAAGQPPAAHILLEQNEAQRSVVPFACASGITSMYRRGNSFDRG